MANRRVVPAALASVLAAAVFFGLGSYLGARPSSDGGEHYAALRAEIELLRKRDSLTTAGTAGRLGAAFDSLDAATRADLVADVKRQLQTEMGLLPVTLLRERRESFVELYSHDDKGGSSYGTAGYLGNGYFITVKHGVVALGQEGLADPRRITSIKLNYRGDMLNARIVDVGDARVEVDPGDWAIVKVKETVDLPALNVNLAFPFDFADPIFRLGNDYSKGIILGTGYIGQRTPNKLVTCLTDGHPGVSGGGVLSQDGDLVGIPVGRMQGDYRFSFILPLREEMFRKVEHLAAN
ncbi:MAG: trypsin-like peptidase domain-containing protein [Acidobacteria bacterium]|nr:trypsin-like peptidase domain-containing protein [Acidobacteriota bacterium]